MWVGWAQYTALVRYLIEKGASVNFQSYKLLGRLSLYQAGEDNSKDMVKLLILYGLEVSLKNELGLSSLHAACEENNEYMKKLLIKNGADIKAVDKYGKIPFHFLNPIQNKFDKFKMDIYKSIFKDNLRKSSSFLQ